MDQSNHRPITTSTQCMLRHSSTTAPAQLRYAPRGKEHSSLSLNHVDLHSCKWCFTLISTTSPTTPPTDNPKYTTSQQRLSYEHDRCTLYAAANLSRGIIISRALFYSVYHIFNHAVKHSHNIEQTLKSRPNLRDSLSRWTYIPNTQTEIIIIKAIITALR